MCADGAIRVLDRILLDGSILSDPLLSIGVLLAASLIAEGLPYIRPHPVISIGPPIRWRLRTRMLDGELSEPVEVILKPPCGHLIEGPMASLLILESLKSIVLLQNKIKVCINK